MDNESNRPYEFYDFAICHGEEGLMLVLTEINIHRCTLVCVTQRKDTYTVFFRKPAYG